eukprot:TRINITY_DN63826_c0_g1_i1.p1 TRINITY_DN63826_c0_g1~~TRINITY_DN63826_c0_g1_i1.p1  ORF type:complete len:1770 (+),score=238.50 TRINITY_DN63826_c0_g1_i1:70-5310(+)
MGLGFNWVMVTLVVLLATLQCVYANYDHLTASKPLSPETMRRPASFRVPEELVHPASQPTYHPRLGVPTFVRAHPMKTPKPNRDTKKFLKQENDFEVLHYVNEFASAYNLDPVTLSGARVGSVVNKDRFVVAKVKQFLHDTEVFGAQLNVIMDKNEKLLALAGHLSPNMRPLEKLSKRNQYTFLNKGNSVSEVLSHVLTKLTKQKAAVQLDLTNTTARPDWTQLNLDNLPGVSKLYVKKVLYEAQQDLIPSYAFDITIDQKEAEPHHLHALIVVSTDDMEILHLSDQTRPVAHKSKAAVQQDQDDVDEPVFELAEGDPGYVIFNGWVDPATGFPGPTIGGTGHPFVKSTKSMLVQPITPVQLEWDSWSDSWFDVGETKTVGNNVAATGVTSDGQTVWGAVEWKPITVTTKNAQGDSVPMTVNGAEVLQTWEYIIPGNQPQVDKGAAESVQGALAQVFFNLNWLHDDWKKVGYDEAAGNTQMKNYGVNDAGQGDPIVAIVDTQAYATEINSELNPWTDIYPDGTSPEIYFPWRPDKKTFKTYYPAMASCLVSHEFGKIMAQRLVDKDMVSGFKTAEGRGIAEGIGDLVCIMNMIGPDDLIPDTTNPNEWMFVENQGWRIGVGINQGFPISKNDQLRRYQYSERFEINPLTFHDMGPQFPTFGGDLSKWTSPELTGWEPHQAGEVVAQVFFDVYYSLLRRHGWAEARERMQEYLVDALQMSQAPTLIQLRDLFLMLAKEQDMEDMQDMADQDDTDDMDGAMPPKKQGDYEAFWEAFARRGLGVHAKGPDNSPVNWGIEESFTPGPMEMKRAMIELGEHWWFGEDNCDSDGILRQGEWAELVIPVINTGTTPIQPTITAVEGTTDDPVFAQPRQLPHKMEPLLPGQKANAKVIIRLSHQKTINFETPVDITVTAEAWSVLSADDKIDGVPQVKLTDTMRTWSTVVQYETALLSHTDTFETNHNVWVTRSNSNTVGWKHTMVDPWGSTARGFWYVKPDGSNFEAELISPVFEAKESKAGELDVQIFARVDLGTSAVLYLEWRAYGGWRTADCAPIKGVDTLGSVRGRFIAGTEKSDFLDDFACKLKTTIMPTYDNGAKPSNNVLQKVRFRFRVVGEANPLGEYGAGVYIDQVTVKGNEPKQWYPFPTPIPVPDPANPQCGKRYDAPTYVDFEIVDVRDSVTWTVEDGCDGDGILDSFPQESAVLSVYFENTGNTAGTPYMWITSAHPGMSIVFTPPPMLNPGEGTTVDARVHLADLCSNLGEQDCNAHDNCEWVKAETRCRPILAERIQIDITVQDSETFRDSSVYFSVPFFTEVNFDPEERAAGYVEHWDFGINNWDLQGGWQRVTNSGLNGHDNYMTITSPAGVGGAASLTSPPLAWDEASNSPAAAYLKASYIIETTAADGSEGLVIQLVNDDGVAFTMGPPKFTKIPILPADDTSNPFAGFAAQSAATGTPNKWSSFTFSSISAGKDLPAGFLVPGKPIYIRFTLAYSARAGETTVYIDDVDVRSSSLIGKPGPPFRDDYIQHPQNPTPNKCPGIRTSSDWFVTNLQIDFDGLMDNMDRYEAVTAGFKKGLFTLFQVEPDSVEVKTLTKGSDSTTTIVWRLVDVFPGLLAGTIGALPTTVEGKHRVQAIAPDALTIENLITWMEAFPVIMIQYIEREVKAALNGEDVTVVVSDTGRAFDYQRRGDALRHCRRCALVEQGGEYPFECEFTVMGKKMKARSVTDWADPTNCDGPAFEVPVRPPPAVLN